MTNNINLEENVEKDVIKTLREVAESDSIVKTWEKKKYGDIQRITNPKKGDFGEKLIAKWLEMFGYHSEVSGRVRKRGGNIFSFVDEFHTAYISYGYQITIKKK